MKKLLVADAALELNISKEAVYNRIRRNTLNSVTENGIKYVIISDEDTKNSPRSKKTVKTRVNDDKYVEFLLEQIGELKQKIANLENDKERLIKDKESLLVSSKHEVENMYKDRDKQFKQMLELVTKPLLTYMNRQDAIDAQFEELTPYEKGLILKTEVDKWIKLEDYMRQKRYSYKKQKNVNQALLSKIGKDKNIKEENGILYIKRGVKIKQIIRKKSWN